ncbi:hypothetical protein AYO49_00325 [Verrucomicrobiaceae bacterium SCGC AG-212-N21]|nr:hypothetical protein AYO49_00325 [Verrucomicrobiaceae bacterium SCGC AG-212-N21]
MKNRRLSSMSENSASPNPAPEAPPTLYCEECGKLDAERIGDRVLCLDCYTGCGSCCSEFGKDDLWNDARLRSHGLM